VWSCIRAALAVLFLHEAFHHEVESFAIRLGIIENRRRDTPYTKDLFTCIAPNHPDDLLYESLARAESYRRQVRKEVYFRGVPPDVGSKRNKWLKEWFPTLRAGYDKANPTLADVACCSPRRSPGEHSLGVPWLARLWAAVVDRL
jgi:hypothetical protein